MYFCKVVSKLVNYCIFQSLSGYFLCKVWPGFFYIMYFLALTLWIDLQSNNMYLYPMQNVWTSSCLEQTAFVVFQISADLFVVFSLLCFLFAMCSVQFSLWSGCFGYRTVYTRLRHCVSSCGSVQWKTIFISDKEQSSEIRSSRR